MDNGMCKDHEELYAPSICPWCKMDKLERQLSAEIELLKKRNFWKVLTSSAARTYGHMEPREALEAIIKDHEMEARQQAAREIFKCFDPWFTSGNAVDVERATILTKDYSAIKAKFGLEEV